MKTIVIVAPHGDDEIIGCFEVMKKACEEGCSIHILYPNSKKEGPGFIEGPVPFNAHRVLDHTCKWYIDIDEITTMSHTQYFFPDPIYETHPEHRKYGYIGEKLLRKGIDVVFYSVNMSAPYIREIKNPDEKLNMLNTYYPEKADLWKYDFKYFLFEGQCKWIGGW